MTDPELAAAIPIPGEETAAGAAVAAGFETPVAAAAVVAGTGIAPAAVAPGCVETADPHPSEDPPSARPEPYHRRTSHPPDLWPVAVQSRC